MDTTVPDIPDSGLVDDFVAQLRGAGIESSDRAVRVLAMHARRRQLDRDQVVAILAQFQRQRWYPDVLRRAGELLEDIGQRASDAPRLELEVVDARADLGAGGRLRRRRTDAPELPESVRRFRAEQAEHYRRETGAGEPASGLLACGCVAAVVREEGEHHLGCTGGDS